MNRLVGRVAIVTGGAQGIGKAVALRCAAEGAKVVTADLQASEATVKEIITNGGEALHVVMDVRDRHDWKRLVTETAKSFGPVGLLANVAGVTNTFGADNIVDLTDEGWNHVIDTDLRGVWLGLQAVIPTMLGQGGGAIVNIASMAALKGLTNLAAYSAAKGGMVSLTRQVAMEYGAQGIRCNCICPGTIDTPILANIPDDLRRKFASSHIIHRLGDPAEIAAATAFFLSDDSAFCTGGILPVDGGWNSKGND
ncbi:MULTISPECIES: SDR family NAD(P)-dependent oxidoreductase [Protofrankia]|uniref:3-oxoacyl-(Acyl-carrier-protein) reductase n=1 Tax=Candidatus Protofrankia datiscae TaxID=2716812 RepID=F8B5A4_9ACTN|nr:MULTISPECIES: SDR family oxidoreductase [Protofrankia]AEH10047.1 3-oxoacyl-(acyl-carrier-protein) reductase [Candidatus Protofrankia datiscae]